MVDASGRVAVRRDKDEVEVMRSGLGVAGN